MKIEFVYDGGCPNVRAARAELIAALAAVGGSLEWKEWRLGDENLPGHVQGYGSPTVLVDGVDVTGALAADSDTACRVYAGAAGGIRRTPGTERIIAALRGAHVETGGSKQGFAGVAVLPALGVAALPKLACPACWPAYSGLLSSVGLGVLIDEAWLLPLTAVFLAVALTALAWGVRRRGAGPFALDSDPAMWGGIVLLAAASAWNAWPLQRAARAPCPRCTPDPEP